MKVKKGDYTVILDGKNQKGGGKGSAKSDIPVRIAGGAEEHGAGGVIDDDASVKKQKELGVPVELPGKSDADKMIEEAQKQVAKLQGNQGQGSGKGLLQRAIEKWSKPQVNWKNELARIIGKIIDKQEEYFGKRKHLYKDEYFYGDKESEPSLRNAMMLVDTSGSMGDEQLKMILGEIYSIIKTKKIKKTEIVYFDDGIQGVDMVKNPPVFDFTKAKGGGGTSFIEPFEEIQKREKQKKLELAVFCTDGHADVNTIFKKYERASFRQKFVWLIINNPSFQAPFGKIVHLKEKVK